MFISVFAFRKPTTTTSSSPPVVPISTTEPIENPTTDLSLTVTNNDEYSRTEETSIVRSHSRRARGMTLAQVLPLFISPVPVRAGITLPPTNTRITRRLSLNARLRTNTLTVESTNPNLKTKATFQRARANTIAVPLLTMRTLDQSLERLRPPQFSPPLASITAEEENLEETEQEEKPPSTPSLLSSQEQIESPDEFVPEETHWLLNSRYILFCVSNFALCLVMGVPYVIIPTYISETFGDQTYLASWTLSSVGIASAIGQILLGYLHDKKICQAWFMYTLAVIISGVSLIILATFNYKLIVLVCAFLYGLAISANYALQILIVIEALSMDTMTNAFGILQFCQGVSTLIGIPIQGRF